MISQLADSCHLNRHIDKNHIRTAARKNLRMRHLHPHIKCDCKFTILERKNIAHHTKAETSSMITKIKTNLELHIWIWIQISQDVRIAQIWEGAKKVVKASNYICYETNLNETQWAKESHPSFIRCSGDCFSGMPKNTRNRKVLTQRFTCSPVLKKIQRFIFTS